MDASWVTWIIQTITALIVGVIGFFLKQFMAEMKSDIRRLSERQDQQEERFNAFTQALPFQYTLREDFIRSTASFDKKLDKVIDMMSGLKRSQ